MEHITEDAQGSPFLKCVVLKWALPVRGAGCKGLPRCLGHFFPTFARLTEGGCLSLIGQCPYRTNTFQKGAYLTLNVMIQVSQFVSNSQLSH